MNISISVDKYDIINFSLEDKMKTINIMSN